jgi:hypothetical protein
MATKSKFDGLAAAIGMLGSNHEGERLAALRGVAAQLKKLNLSWVDIGQAVVQREQLLAAAKQLQAERDAALHEAARLKHHLNGDGGGALAQAWTDTGTPRTVESRHAAWLLGLGRYFTQKEIDFLNSCARRRGPLSPAQRDWLSDLVRTTVARTGQAPPP